MKSRTTTADRILQAGRTLFNDKGYAATTLTEIAAVVGISQGNLTYHFPTKSDLALRLISDARQHSQNRRATKRPGDIADDYVEHLLFAMDMTWNHRFALRDRGQVKEAIGVQIQDTELSADFDELRQLVYRIEKEGMFRRDYEINIEKLTRSLWIVSRYWMDYLRETEELDVIDWEDQERGIEQHFTVLLPCLTASARKEFTAALERRSKKLGMPQ
ncbi:MAG: TetR family transcriptional regulator [Rhodobiaceae bacterium]|nr:TetR family transcriptional regulator [Rhodobiaceae bacterium]